MSNTTPVPLAPETPLRFHLRGIPLLNEAQTRGLVTNRLQVIERSGMSRPTIYSNYVVEPGEMSDKVSMTGLFSFLYHGLGYTLEDLAKMSFLDVFAVIQGSDIIAEGQIGLPHDTPEPTA